MRGKPSTPKLGKMPLFTGVKGELAISDWLPLVRERLRAEGVSKEKWITWASSYFSGRAQRWWTSKLQLDRATVITWSFEEFCAAVMNKFEPMDAQLVAREEIAARLMTTWINSRR